MYCSNCGKEIQDGAKFCPNCGSEIVKNNSSNGTEKKQLDVQKSRNQKGTKNGYKFLMLPASIYIILGIIGSVYGNTRSIYGAFRPFDKKYDLLAKSVFQSANIFIGLLVVGVILLALSIIYKLRKTEFKFRTRKIICIILLLSGIVISTILAIPYVLFAIEHNMIKTQIGNTMYEKDMQSRSEETVTEKTEENRPFTSLEDYARGESRSITYYDSGEEYSLTENNAKIVFRKNVVAPFGDKDTYRNALKENLEKDLFDNCGEMIYLNDIAGESKLYLYYRIKIKNEEGLQALNCPAWNVDDEIYMIATFGVGNNNSGTTGVRVTCFIKNYSSEISEQTNSSDDEYSAGMEALDGITGENVTGADWSTPCTDKIIQTEVYSVTVPDSWINKCAYEIAGDGYTLSFMIPRGYDGINDSGLCTITVIYGSLKDVLTPYVFIETIESEEYGKGHLIVESPGDKQYTDATEEEYILLAEDTRLLIDSISLAEGTKIISTKEPCYRDFNIYDYNDVIVKEIEYIESQEEKIEQPYAELKEIYKSGVASTFQGREYDENLIAECLIEYEFNNANINLECLGTYPVQSNVEWCAPKYYLYYKVNIMDIDDIRQNYNADWNVDDEIYLIAETGLVFNRIPGEEEDNFFIAYRIKNFSESF